MENNTGLHQIMEEYAVCDDPKRKQETAQLFADRLRAYQIIIYGAGAIGTSLLAALRMNGMEPVFFVDRRYDECPAADGVPVRAPDALAALPEGNAAVILAINAEVIRSFASEPLERLKKLRDDVEILREGVDVVRVLKIVHCSERLRKGETFSLKECLDCGGETKLCDVYQRYLYQTAVGRKALADKPSGTFDWFGYIMGQFCSLKCRDCCEHVPYYQEPVFSRCETVLADCEKIAASCEFIRYIELIGGEPLMNPDFERIVEGLLQIENVGYVKIFTNGTIVPNDEILRLLKNQRVVVHMSNYTAQAKGRLLENIYQTMKCLQDHGIPYLYSESREWADWGGFHDRGRAEEELAYNFSHCFCANCHRVFQGILYRCPHQYAGIRRGLMAYTEGEYIDLHSCTANELAEKLEAFEKLPFTDGCRRCDMPFDCPVVPAGVQLEPG